MLVRFVVGNFLSFNKEVEFNMISSSLKNHRHHVYDVGKVSLLKAAAIYGANGAGKSNLIKAVEFLQELVIHGFIEGSVNNKKYKLEEANLSLPISFEIEIVVAKKMYSYGLEISDNSIQNEWLYETNVTKPDKLIFERSLLKSGKSKIIVNPKYQKTSKQKFLIELMKDRLLQKNELLLGKASELQFHEVQLVKNYFEHSLYIIHPSSKFQTLPASIISSKKFNDFANSLLNTFDTGVSSLSIESIDLDKFIGEEDEDFKMRIKSDLNEGEGMVVGTSDGAVFVIRQSDNFIVKKVITEHINQKGIRIPFELPEESEGTQRLLDFIPAFHKILTESCTFLIDEIDQSLHPYLLKSLIKKIMNEKSTQGQFIFTTHESNLLDFDIFRQDEIWFVEKERKSGSSELYSLVDFKPRYDLDIRKGYLKGRFGAIPFLANLDDLQWNSKNEA